MADKYLSVPALRELLSIPSDGDCEKCNHYKYHGCYNDELVRACEAIDDAPEADVVEVVRCKDCAEWDRNWTPTWDQTGDAHYCGMVDGVTKSSFFCAHGERREAT